MSRISQTDPELTHRLTRRGMLGVAAGATAAALLGAATAPSAYTFAQNLTKVLDDAQALGLRHIGTASGPGRYGNTVDAWKRAAEEFNAYGAAAKARGMKFYQHNHSDEFAFATDNPKV